MSTEDPETPTPAENQQDPDDLGMPDEFLDAIPEEERGRVIKAFRMMISSGSHPNPIADKITSEHITQLFGLGDKQDERKFNDKQQDRIFNGFIFLVCLIFVGALIYFLKDDAVLLEKIITLILGFGSGFGVGKLTNKKEQKG